MSQFTLARVWTVDECNEYNATLAALDPRPEHPRELNLTAGGEPRAPGDCEPFPESNTITNPRFVFLREVGGKNCLKSFLDMVTQQESYKTSVSRAITPAGLPPSALDDEF